MQGLIQKLQGYRDRSHSLIIETEDEEEAEIELTRDQFNLNKIVVVVTAAGKVSVEWNIKVLCGGTSRIIHDQIVLNITLYKLIHTSN